MQRRFLAEIFWTIHFLSWRRRRRKIFFADMVWGGSPLRTPPPQKARGGVGQGTPSHLRDIFGLPNLPWGPGTHVGRCYSISPPSLSEKKNGA